MIIMVQELSTDGITQELTPDHNVILEAVRPHLYRHNFADGALTIQIFDSDDNQIAESDPVNISDIGTLDFYHGYVRFYINAGLLKDQTYTFKLVGTDYTFDEAAYIGWCNGLDLGKYPPSIEPATALQYPLDLEVWERSTR